MIPLVTITLIMGIVYFAEPYKSQNDHRVQLPYKNMLREHRRLAKHKLYINSNSIYVHNYLT